MAPVNGLVVYANDPGRGLVATNRRSRKADGPRATEDPEHPRSELDAGRRQGPREVGRQARPDRKAKVRVDAFPDEVFDGVVQDVAPLPDPGTFFNQDIKVYSTHVRIDRPIPSLRPGMTAEVEILVNEIDDVLLVPIEAFLVHEGRYYDSVAVRKPGGGFEWRKTWSSAWPTKRRSRSRRG